MNIFRKYRQLWVAGMVIVIAILFIVNFSTVVAGVKTVLHAFSPLMAGAALAFILNLILDPAENLLAKSNIAWVRKKKRTLGILISLIVVSLILVLIMSIVIPNLVSAVQVLTNEAPSYMGTVQKLIEDILDKIPGMEEKAASFTIDWKSLIETVVGFATKGTEWMSNTVDIVTSVIGGVVNSIIIIIFAIYVLADKERFIALYRLLLSLTMSSETSGRLTRALRIVNNSFRAFIAGEIIEAGILSTMCIIGMLILQLPYAMMIGVLVGVINMIPMVGAFIGGAIGAFLIFTVSPVKCLIFVVFLIVIQQIESNIFFPRIIGNKVGLPGIYVMITIVVGGSLFGVLGMILGVPLMASIYKISNDYIAELKARRKTDKNLSSQDDVIEEENASDKPISGQTGTL
jgi:predicted PurR-regulated permease PerM